MLLRNVLEAILQASDELLRKVRYARSQALIVGHFNSSMKQVVFELVG